ncbi:MFS transporter [Cysteiniphilum litorale]|uniref:MFS transporter n=3 Tax=Cysteiniphilum litorale TaxID=2056700 RepID=UPI003F884E5B
MSTRLRNIYPVLLGESLESYDFFLYGLLSVYFSKIFFPPSGNSLVFAFLLFSTAYVARPFGSIIWGHVADKYGRKNALIGTLSLMAIPAFCMAIMPPYESIGILSCFLVLILRFLQGIAFGGESPTVIVTLYELAPENKKGLYGSFYNPGLLLGYFAGIILIILLTYILGDKHMQTFGWRFMFCLSLVFIAVLSYMRLNLIETSIKTHQSNFPILTTIKHDLPAILKIFLYVSCASVMFWNLLFHNYLIIWAGDFGLQSLIMQACVVFFVILLIPCVGYLSDKINKLNLLKINYICITVIAPLLYLMFMTKQLSYMVIGYFIFSVFTAITCALSPAIIVPQVSKNCRVSSIGLSAGLTAMFGSFVPAINEIIIKTTQTTWSPAFLISLCALISLITLYTLKTEDI